MTVPAAEIVIDAHLADGINPCPEGQYRDYSESTAEVYCRDLVRDTGFKWDVFEEALGDTLIVLEHCDWDSLAFALLALEGNGGGTLRLPECSIEAIRNPALRLPSNSLIEGAGIGKTTIWRSDPLRSIFNLRGENVVIRDMSLEGGTNPFTMIYSNNVLIERMGVSGARLNGINFNYCRNVTVRYSYSYGHEQNGIISKDCFPSSIVAWKCTGLEGEEFNDCASGIRITEAVCEEAITFVADSVHRHPIEPGSMWTTGYAVYSNQLSNSSTAHGAALHAGHGEIAGNWFFGNYRGLKMPDSRDVYVHHNLFENNTNTGIHVYLVIEDHFPVDIRFFKNRIRNNGEFAFRFEGVQQVFLINNHYQGNFACPDPSYSWCQDPKFANVDWIRNDAWSFDDGDDIFVLPTVYVCPGDQDSIIEVSGWEVGRGPDSLCTMAVPVEDDLPGEVSDLSIYPNPATGRTHLSYMPEGLGIAVVELFDTLGRRVRLIHRGYQSPSSQMRLDLDVSDLPSGLYLVRVTVESSASTKPLVVRR